MCRWLESKPRLRLSRLRSSDYGANIIRYNFRNSAANNRVFFFLGLGMGFMVRARVTARVRAKVSVSLDFKIRVRIRMKE